MNGESPQPVSSEPIFQAMLLLHRLGVPILKFDPAYDLTAAEAITDVVLTLLVVA